MIPKFILFTAIAVAFALSFLAQKQLDTLEQAQASVMGRCERIASMAPSTTETLYALGLGDRVVGVTRYCAYPPEVESKARIGGYFDPNFEAILALQPDLVVLLEEHAQTLPGFQRLNLSTHVVCHKNIEGIVESFRTIGRVCGREAAGRQMAEDYERRMLAIQRKTAGLPRPKVLLAVDRTPTPNHLSDVYIAGADGYFDRMIELAGGENVYRDRIRFPVVSVEGILSLHPDVIVDLTSKVAMQQRDARSIAADWNELAELEAVRRHRVFVFDQPYACVPGPRFIQVLEDLARVLHPEVDWGNVTGQPLAGTGNRCIFP
jgi:iron complex transport system substrate-binding protein